jgi:hypothetical protein
MKRILYLIGGIVLSLVIAAGMYFWATSMIDSMYAHRSPLVNDPPKAGAPLGQPATRRVVIILVDGLRLDTSLDAAIMPTLAQLRSDGASAVMHSRAPSYSEPSYVAILTGAWPDINDGPSLNLDYGEIFQTTQDEIFTNAKQAGFTTAISGFNWFEELFPQSSFDYAYYTAGEDKVADRAVVNAALPWLDDPTINLVLIHLDQVDYAGHHEGGGGSSGWNEAANRCDGLIAEILAKLDLAQDTVIVLSDHGHLNVGGHGGTEQVVTTEPFVIAGKGIRPGVYGNINMVDVAPTIASLLGISLPASTQGQVLTDMLALPEKTLANLPAAMINQQTQLVNAYSVAIGVPIPAGSLDGLNSVSGYQEVMQNLRQTRLSHQRLPAIIICSLLLIGLLALGVIFWKKQMPWLLLGIVIYGVCFNLLYLFLGHLRYSFSTLSSAMGIIINTALFCLLAYLPAWLIIGLGTKQFTLKPIDAANRSFALTFTIAGALAIPILIHVALNGLLVTWALPDFLWMYIGLISMIQLLMVVIVGLLYTGISVITASIVRKLRKS